MRRRYLIGGVGITGLAGIGTFVYRAAPAFWKQYASDMSRPIGQPALRPDPRQWPETGLHAAWLGHSTVLLKVDGTTILTDPVFSDRVGLSLGPVTLGLKRLVAPAAPLIRIPKVDLVLLSHAHMDHFDIPTLRLLENAHTSVVTAPRTSDLLRPRRYREVRELAWGERARVGAAEPPPNRVHLRAAAAVASVSSARQACCFSRARSASTQRSNSGAPPR